MKDMRRFDAKLMMAIVELTGVTAFGQTTILSENFEGVFPGSWSVSDSNPAGITAYWNRVDLTVFGTPLIHGAGSSAGYCAGLGYGGNNGSPTYQNSMDASMSRSINLSGYTVVSLSFWYIIPTIQPGNLDKCRVYLDSTLLFERTVAVTSWTQATFDLSAYTGGTHTLKFEFVSDLSGTAEGWYLDDILVTAGPPPAPPGNDQCGGAIAMTAGATYTLNTANATATGDPTPSCQSTFGGGVWYTVTPASSGSVTISTCGSDFDTVVQAYTGGCGALTAVNGGCDDENGPSCAGHQASANFAVTGGRTYWILAGGYEGASGNLSIVATASTNKAGQTITFGPLDNKSNGEPPFAVNATASSGLPVSFSILSGPATISVNTVTLIGIGTVAVRASQAGDSSYNPAPNVDRTFTVYAPPAFSLTRSGTYLVISWPTNVAGFVLQSATNLTPLISWPAVTPGPTVVNGRYTVTNTPSGNHFFRLRK